MARTNQGHLRPQRGRVALGVVAPLALIALLALPWRPLPADRTVLLPRLQAQNSTRFMSDAWHGSFSHVVKKKDGTAAQADPYVDVLDYSATGTFKLKRIPPKDTSGDVFWEGPADAAVHYDVEDHIPDWGAETLRADGGVRGTAQLRIDFANGSYRLQVDLGEIQFQYKGYELSASGDPIPVSATFAQAVGFDNQVFDDPGDQKTYPPDTVPVLTSVLTDPHVASYLPSAGVQLTDHDTSMVGDISAAEPSTSETTTYTVIPGEAPSWEVVVTPENYKEWLPQGGLQESDARSPLKVVAKLQFRGGKKPDELAKKFVFELVNTSHEPGVCMNYPAKSAGPAAADLQLAPDPGKLEFDPKDTEHQHGETPDGSYETASAVINSYDWGAYGTLRVTAVLPDGTRVVGHLAGQDDGWTNIQLPRRDPNSKIADFWKEQHGVNGLPDNDDAEDTPVGDGDKGDGLSLYEEYRGFYDNKLEHFHGDPKVKDLFVLNAIGAKATPALKYLESVSGLKVHELSRSEVDFSTQDPPFVVNFQYSGQAPHRIDEHAVDIVATSREGSARSLGGPGLPRQILRIEMPFNVTGKLATTVTPTVSYYTTTLVHELLHSVNVWHHGETDDTLRWDDGGDDQIVEQELNEQGKIVAAAYPIRVIRESDGVELKVSTLGYKMGEDWIVGGQQGQHSGQEDCLMRYDVAQAYVFLKDPKTRYLVFPNPEKAGTILCSTPKGSGHDGTGVNAVGRTPQPRYGDSASGRGDCAHQICVNDAMQHVSR